MDGDIKMQKHPWGSSWSYTAHLYIVCFLNWAVFHYSSWYFLFLFMQNIYSAGLDQRRSKSQKSPRVWRKQSLQYSAQDLLYHCMGIIFPSAVMKNVYLVTQKWSFLNKNDDKLAFMSFTEHCYYTADHTQKLRSGSRRNGRPSRAHLWP